MKTNKKGIRKKTENQKQTQMKRKKQEVMQVKIRRKKKVNQERAQMKRKKKEIKKMKIQKKKERVLKHVK